MILNPAKPNSIWSRPAAALRRNPLFRYPDLGLMCLGVFVMLVGVGAVVPIRAIYARDHGATAQEIGLLASSYLMGAFLFQFPGGWASDRWGRKPLLVAGVALAGVISFMFLLSDNPWWFISLRFIEGAAGGAIGPATNAYVVDAVPARERGAAFGWLGSAFSAGFMMGPAIGGFMVDGFGVLSPFIFGGVTSLLVALLMAVKLSNLKPGSKPVGSVESVPSVEPAEEDKARPRPTGKLFATGLLGAVLLTVAGGFGDGIFMSIWTIWLDDLGAPIDFIGWTFILFSLPMMIFTPITGKWADKYRLAPLIMVPGLLVSTIYISYGFTENLIFIAGIGLLEGLFIAIMIPAQSAFIANLSPDNARGRVQGIVSTARTIAGVTSSMLTAWLYFSYGASFPWLMLATAQVLIITVGGLLIWRVERATMRRVA